jgi:hypothetical protein
LLAPFGISVDGCVRPLRTVATATENGSTSTSTALSWWDTTDNIRIHQPYAIAWKQQDRPSLSPKPPELPTCPVSSGYLDPTITSWSPNMNMTVSPSCIPYWSEPSDGSGLVPLVYVATIPPSIFGFLVICFCVWCLCRRRRRKKSGRRRTGADNNVSLVRLQ